MGSRRRGNTFTRFLEDIVDDTKDAVVDVADDDEREERDAGEAAALRKQLDDLRAKIDQLTAMQKDTAE